MKRKLSELNANPFKEKIAGGQLDEETVKKLMANLDELGLMGALPIIQRNHRYYLVNGHHRVEALKQKFGNDYQVEVELHNYDDDQLLRGMVVENLTQRSNEFHQELDNLLAIRNHLKEKSPQTLSDYGQGRKENGTFDSCPGSAPDVANWLDKNSGDIMKLTKIKDILRIADDLDEELLEDVKKQSHASGEKDEDDETIGVKVATALASFKDKQEQKDLAKAIKQSRDQHGNQVTKNLTFYKNAPDEIKKQVRQLTLDIADVEDEIEKQELIEEAEKRPKTIFIPNFTQRMKDFDKNVKKLESQIKLFSNVFHSSEFKERYNILKPKQKEKLNFVIFNIRERIQKCQDEIEFFMEQLPDNVILLEAKQ